MTLWRRTASFSAVLHLAGCCSFPKLGRFTRPRPNYPKDSCTGSYIWLARNAVERRQLLWPSRPKFHASMLGPRNFLFPEAWHELNMEQINLGTVAFA